MANDPQDREFISAIEGALSNAWDRYHAASAIDKPMLRPQVDLAYQSWLGLRMKLLEPATMTSTQDVIDARALGVDIDKAADQQQLVFSLVKFVGLLSKFP